MLSVGHMVDAAANGLAIEAEHITKRFKRHQVLDQVSIQVPRGTAAVVQGANGAGKTTLLRILATVVTADSGSAHVAGFDIRREAGHVRAQIGVAFVNERSIFWRLNALENLFLFAATRGVPPNQRRPQIRAIAEELGMTHFLTQRISELSTGQRQRIILARAALGDPEVLLIDEPLRGLDETGVEAALGFIRRRIDTGAGALIAAPTVTEFRGRGFSLFRLVDGRLTLDQW